MIVDQEEDDVPEMRRVTIRFGHSLWRVVAEEARRDGVSAAQFVRDGALARVMWQRGRRGEPLEQSTAELTRALREEEAAEMSEITLAVQQVLAHAAPELNAVLRALDATAPEQATYVRQLYGVAPRAFAAEDGAPGVPDAAAPGEDRSGLTARIGRP